MTFLFRPMTMLVCVLCLSATFAVADDWPQWRGAARDGSVAGFNEPAQWRSELTLAWKTQVGIGDASPALVNGKLYVFSRQAKEEVVRCLDAESGEQIWRSAYDSIEVKGAAGSHSGPRSSPAVAGGKVVTLGVAGVLTCFDAATGKVLWRKDEFPDDHPSYFTSASPMIVDQICIAQLGGKESGALVAYDLNSGNELWRSAGDPPEYASPVLMTIQGDQQIVTLTKQNLIGISLKDGQPLWKTPFAPGRMSTNSATPVVSGDIVMFSAQKRGTNAVRIAKSSDGFEATKLWSNADISTAFNTPVLNGNLLFGVSDRKTLYCLNVETGSTQWTGDESLDSFATIVDVGSALFVLPRTGELIAYKPIGSAYEELARYKVADSGTYSYPVIAGNRVYVQDQDFISAWSFE